MEKTKKTRIIGISGCATSGKDTFTNILIERLKLKNKTATRIALASPLKKMCDSFCRENLSISSLTQDPTEKTLIRPLLVWFGDVKRKLTNGRFWVNLADQSISRIEDDGYDYIVITDIRYDHYEKDEVYWLKREKNGILVHISRWYYGAPVTSRISQSSLQKIFVQPANDHEMINDPKVKKKSDYTVEWETIGDNKQGRLEDNESMIRYVDEFISHSGL